MADPRYPHMMPEDVPVWDRWLQSQVPDWTEILYDVKVGRGVDTPEDYPEPYASMAAVLSKKRIDAVLVYPDQHIIVEVKKLADWKAIGQLMGYPVLYERYLEPGVPIIPLLIAESLTLDLQDILEYYDLPYVLVPPIETTPQHTIGEPL
jgi:hypothetical protein